MESPGLARFLNAAPKDLPEDNQEPAFPQQVEEAQVREIPVTAVILAAKSTFFMKLFTTGMRETVDKRVVTVHLTAKGGLPSPSPLCPPPKSGLLILIRQSFLQRSLSCWSY